MELDDKRRVPKSTQVPITRLSLSSLFPTAASCRGKPSPEDPPFLSVLLSRFWHQVGWHDDKEAIADGHERIYVTTTYCVVSHEYVTTISHLISLAGAGGKKITNSSTKAALRLSI